jgi:hypothetical protein
MDYTETPYGVPILSSRLVEVISRVAGNDVQVVRTRVGSSDGYWIMNVLRAVRCIDESRSDYRKWTEADGRPDRIGQYRAVDILRVDPTKIDHSARIFRLDGWKVAVLASEEVADAIRRENFIGPVFQDVT